MKKKRSKYISFMILFAMLFTNIAGIGSGLQVKAIAINNLIVSTVTDKENVIINVTNSVATSDWVTITLYNKNNNNLVFLNQIKLVEGQGSADTKLDPGAYYGYAKSYSDSTRVEITDFTIVAEQPPVKSTDATLKTITVSGVALENFAAGTTSYSKVLAAGTTVVPTVAVTAADKATAVVTAATALPGATRIVVTAEDGITTTTYTINFTVAPPVVIPSDPIEDSKKDIIKDVEVDNTGGEKKAVVTVNPEVISKDKVNEIKPTLSADTKALEVSVPVDKIKDGAGSLAVVTDKLKLDIPFKVVDFSKTEIGATVKVQKSSSSTDESIKEVKSVGEVYNFSLALYSKTGTKLEDVSDFNGDTKVKITINLTDAQIKNLNTAMLGALYYNESSKKWDYVGGKYDAATRTFSFETEHFSKYTIADMSSAPVFDAVVAQNVDQGNFLQFKVNAKSSNNISLTYSANNLPAGASFDAANQNLNWTPAIDQAGSYTMSFNVTDGVTAVKKDVTVVVRDVPAAELVEKALVEKDFYHFNIAYYKVVKLSDEKEKAENLDKLATIHDLVWNADIANINKTFENLVATGSGKIYAEVEATIINTNLSAVDKGYLLGELTSWGKKLVFTDAYKAAVEAVVYADKMVRENSTNKVDAINKAEAAIAKVTNTYSKEYLLGELATIKAKMK